MVANNLLFGGLKCGKSIGQTAQVNGITGLVIPHPQLSECPTPVRFEGVSSQPDLESACCSAFVWRWIKRLRSVGSHVAYVHVFGLDLLEARPRKLC